MRRVLSISFVFSLSLLVLSAAAFAQVSTKEFAPVQGGFTQFGEQENLYREGRVMVKLSRSAMANMSIREDIGNKAGRMVTGLASLDRTVAPHGLRVMKKALTREPLNLSMAQSLGADQWFAMDFDHATDMVALAEELKRDPNVEDANPDWRAFPAAVPTDPLHPDHWGHNNTVQLNDLDWGGTYEHTLPNTVGTFGFDANAHAAWDNASGYGSSSVVIAILDSGVDVGHPDLRQVSGWDYGDNDSNPDDNSSQAGHGTACAGIAASIQNNGIGAAGIAGGASIMPLKVANSAGQMFFSSIIDAIYHAADNGADIISMSLGAAISSDPATDAALTYADNAGVTSFAATGNENTSSIGYPANNIHVISVGAASPCGERKRSSSSSSEVNPGVSTDPNGYTCDGERWWGSNWGSTTQDSRFAVDIIAPTILPTTDIQGGGGYDPGNYDGHFNGTSCSTPYVAGVAALILTSNPGWSPDQVRAQITSTAQDVTSVESGAGWDRYTGYGMIDAAAATGGGGGPVVPVADFTADVTSGNAPLTVNFTDTSSNGPTSWSWTFGDGGTSSSQNPSYNYTSAGTYTVSLTATNSAGSDGETKTNYITVTDPGNLYATLPFSDGFESGSLGPNWTSSEGAEGRIQVTSSNTPRSGSFHLTMDDHTNGGSFSQNEAWLHLDLSGESQVDLDFWWKDFSDETHSQDGVYFSDNGGSSFSKVLDLNGQSYTNNVWNNFQVDVDAEAASAGLSLSSTFVIKFQQYDNYGITTDGMAWDDISVTAGPGGSPPVADFTADTTSGTAPLTVNFTDTSTGGATGWSWDFGDGGTSSAQNPSYNYASAGTYTVTLTASNAFGSDDEVKTNYITVTTGGGGGTWQTITYDDFESGWGNYVDGGSDCRRSSRDAAYAWEGTYCARIRDNTSTSVFTHGSSHDVSGYVDLEVEFYFYVRSMENGEDFWLQYSSNGGSTWQTVATYIQGTNVFNNNFYTDTVQIPAGTYSYTSDARLRFRNDASGNSDWIYVDAITWRGLTPSSPSGDDLQVATKQLPTVFSAGQNYPNPFNPMTSIQFALPTAEDVELVIYDPRGRQVAVLAKGRYEAGVHTVNWNATKHASGVYFYKITAGKNVETKKMLLLK